MNTITKTRSNYFKVKDPKAFVNLIDKVGCSRYWSENDKYAFGDDGDGMFIYVDDNDNIIDCHSPDAYELDIADDLDPFYKELQKIIADDDAVIVTTICYEGLRSLDASAVIVTSTAIEYLDFDSMVMDKAREILNNSDWKTKNYY